MNNDNYIDRKAIRKHARDLRKKLTDSEKLLWEHIRNRRLSGYKFLRQHPILYKTDSGRIKYFIADFYCDVKGTVIKLDGPIHYETVEYDQFRDEEMRIRGLNILRIKNEKLSDINATLEKIKLYLASID